MLDMDGELFSTIGAEHTPSHHTITYRRNLILTNLKEMTKSGRMGISKT